MLASRVDLAGVTRALDNGYDLSQIATHLRVDVEVLEIALAALRGRQTRCVKPRIYSTSKSAVIALTEYRNLYWFDGCRRCGGDLYVDDDEIKCLACGRALHLREQNKLIERMKEHGRIS